MGAREHTREKEIYQIRAGRGGTGEPWEPEGACVCHDSLLLKVSYELEYMHECLNVDVEVIQDLCFPCHGQSPRH